MPDFNATGPASTPQLYLDNQYRLMQKRAKTWERQLQSKGLDDEAYNEEVSRMQKQLDSSIAFYQDKSQELQQTQEMMDLGLIADPSAGAEAMWSAVLPEEARKAMFPQQPEVSKREPFSVDEVREFSEKDGSIEQFAKGAETQKKKVYGGRTGWDWVAKDRKIRTQATLMVQYRAWKQMIGYQGFTPTEQRQVDGEWDTWLKNKGSDWKWDATSKYVRAERANGPFTRAYGSPFRKTPTGPSEATNPLQISIARTLPKKKEQPTAEELLQNRTEENYELGKSLGYWK